MKALALAAVIVSAAVQLFAAESAALVQDWGNPRRLRFGGNKTYSAEQLRGGLLTSFEYLIAAHPFAPRSNYLDVLKTMLTRGYRNDGFPEVQVSADLDEGKQIVSVKIEEGPRFRNRGVVVRGNKSISVPTLASLLTNDEAAVIVPSGPFGQSVENQYPRYLDSQGKEVKKQPPLWKPGHTTSFVGDSNVLSATVERVLHDMGYPFAKAAATIARDDAARVSDLQVSIIEEGPHAVIKEIEVRGLRKNSTNAILSLLNLKPGTAMEAGLVKRSERTLWESGRFHHYSVTPSELPADGNAIRLVIDVQELTNAPSLSEPLSREAKALLKCRDWLSQTLQREDIMLRVRSHDMPPWLRNIALVLSRSGFALASDPNAITNVAAAQWTISMDGESLAWFAPSAKTCFSIARGTNIHLYASLSLLPMLNSEKSPEEFSFAAGAGFKHRDENDRIDTNAAVEANMLLAPAVFVREAYAPDRNWKWNGDVLTVGDTNLSFAVDSKTGQPSIARFADDTEEGNFGISLGFERGEFDRVSARLKRDTGPAANTYREGHGVSSFLSFLAAQPEVLGRASEATNSTWLQQLAIGLNLLIQSGAFEPLDRMGEDFARATESGFYIPPPQLENAPQMMEVLLATVGAYVFRIADTMFPEHSWPSVLAHEGVFMLAGRPVHSPAQLQKLFTSGELGPLGYLMMAKLLSFAPGSSTESVNAVTTAMRGLEHLSTAEFRKDARLLFEGESALAQTFGRIVAFARKLPEAQLSATLGADQKSSTWSKQLLATLRETNNTPAEVGSRALDLIWENLWRKDVAAALTNICADAIQRAAAEKPYLAALKLFQSADAEKHQGEALKLFRDAAELHHPGAYFYLGVFYENGFGVERDFRSAAEWYRRAAENNILPAQSKLGDWLSDGLTLPENYPDAYVWLMIAALRGDTVSAVSAKRVYRKLSNAQVDEATKRITAWGENHKNWMPRQNAALPGAPRR